MKTPRKNTGLLFPATESGEHPFQSAHSKSAGTPEVPAAGKTAALPRWKLKSVMLGMLCCMMMVSACATAPNTPATRTARADYPGKNNPGKCYIFGNSLYKEMVRQGIPSWKIVYHGSLVPSGYEFAYHEVVVYRDQGKYWVVDNLFPYPTAIDGSNADEWVQHLCSQTASGLDFSYRIESVNDVPM